MTNAKSAIIQDLRAQLLQLQGFKTVDSSTNSFALGLINNAFPDRAFPLGCVHEFIAGNANDNAPTCAFVGSLLSTLLFNKGVAIWIRQKRSLFPPALSMYSLKPDQIIFVDTKNDKDALWAMEEALKCSAIAAVVAEIKNIDFTQSRRLQLAVEESKVTGFLIRHIQQLNTTATVTRWRITALPCAEIEELPGMGLPRWRVELLRVRNGKPGSWYVTWRNGHFDAILPYESIPSKMEVATPTIHRQVG